jgi:hypothetical protein
MPGANAADLTAADGELDDVDAGTSVLPRATGINLRTMEIFRTIGLDGAITAAAMDVRGKPLWVRLETLRGPASPSAASTCPGSRKQTSPARPAFPMRPGPARIDPGGCA